MELDNDWVFVMIGYCLNYDLLFSFGFEILEDEVWVFNYNLEILEISLFNVFLVGVVCVGMKINLFFIENIRDYGMVIVK